MKKFYRRRFGESSSEFRNYDQSFDVYTNYDPLTDTYLPTTVNITSVELAGENTTGNVKGTFSGTIAKFVNGEIVDEVELRMVKSTYQL